MIRIKLVDGSTKEIRREEIQGIAPLEGILSHAELRFDAIVYREDRILPVAGPIPDPRETTSSHERFWLMLLQDHAQVILGLPRFDDDITLSALAMAPQTGKTSLPAQEQEKAEISDDEETRLLAEMEELLKSA
jgi:hypothetical protein